MGIFGFTWADGGAFAGGALGAALLGPPGAMLGSAAGSFVGAAWGDDKGTGAALEEALVAGIGAAGGAWATNLAGALLKDGVAAAATRTLSAGAARRADRIAARTLLPWNARGGGPIAGLGGAFGGYEVSAQARLPVQIATTDIGNGGCPAQLASLRMPADLTGPVGAMYHELPDYLCDVWRSFGTGPRQAPPAPRVPAMRGGADPSGIAEYAAKARRLETMTAGFAQLDARAVALIADGAGRITAEGRTAVGSLVGTVNRRAAETPPPGSSSPIHALDLLNEAFERGREILSQAVTAGDRVAGQVRGLTDELASLREQLDAHRARPAPGGAPSTHPVPAPPPIAVPGSFCPSPPVGPARSRPDETRSGARESAVSDSAADRLRPAPEPPVAPMGGGVVDAGPCPSPWSRSPESGYRDFGPVGGPVTERSFEEFGQERPLVQVMPVHLPAAWSGTGANGPAVFLVGGSPSAAGSGPPGSGSKTPAVAVSGGTGAPAGPSRTPWTGLSAAVVPGGHAGAWPGSAPAPCRMRSAGESAHEPGISAPDEQLAVVHPQFLLSAAGCVPASAVVISGQR